MTPTFLLGATGLAELLFEQAAPRPLFLLALGAALLASAWCFWAYLRRDRLTLLLGALRLGFLLLLAWCLALPLSKQALSELLKPRFVVALDTSASMTLSPAAGVSNRWTVAQQVLRMPWVQSLAAQCELEVYPFAQTLGEKLTAAQATGLKPDGTATPLREQLGRLVERYRGQHLAGLLLLSDGLDTREASDSWAGLPLPCPVYTVRPEPPGAWEVEADVRVDSLETPRRVVVGMASKLTATVSGQGTKGEPIHVQLFRDGQLQQDVPTQIPADGGAREVSFPLENKELGAFTYRVVLPAIRGETHTNDNSYAVAVQVVDAKNRLFYVEGTPRFESKYLTRVLQANPNITLLAFIRGPGGSFLTYGRRGNATLDLSEEQMAQLKMMVIGDLDQATLGAARAASILRFVENGGSLIVLGGPKAWGSDAGLEAGELSKLLPLKLPVHAPAEEGRFTVTLTPEGRTHPAFLTKEGVWESLPPVLSVFAGAQPKPGAQVLANAVTPSGRQPLLVAQRYGQGKVIALLTDTLWRWQLDPGADQPYARFWGQLLQWMVPQEEQLAAFTIDLFANSDRLFLGDAIQLNVRVSGLNQEPVADATLTLELQTPDERKLPFPMARRTLSTATGKPLPGYAVDYTPEQPGLYKAVARGRLNNKPTESVPYSFFVKPFTPESNPRPARADLLATLAKVSGGRFCEPTEINAVLAALTIEADKAERVRYQSLWNRWWILLLLVALISTEWYIRRMRNMA